MTFQEKFDELKAKYGKVNEKKLSEPFAIQVNMTEDESQGTFYVAYINGVFAVEPYDYRDHTAMITLPVALLEDILCCKANPVEAYLAGNLSVEGNVDHAMMMVDLMAKKPRAPRAKKPAVAEKAEKAVKAVEEKVAAKKTAAKAEKAVKAVEKKAEDAVKAVEEKVAAKKPAAKKAAAKKPAEKKPAAKKTAKKDA